MTTARFLIGAALFIVGCGHSYVALLKPGGIDYARAAYANTLLIISAWVIS